MPDRPTQPRGGRSDLSRVRRPRASACRRTRLCGRKRTAERADRTPFLLASSSWPTNREPRCAIRSDGTEASSTRFASVDQTRLACSQRKCPTASRRARTTSRDCVPVWRWLVVASGGQLASADASVPAAPTAQGGRRRGGTRPLPAAHRSALGDPSTAPLQSSGRMPSQRRAGPRRRAARRSRGPWATSPRSLPISSAATGMRPGNSALSLRRAARARRQPRGLRGPGADAPKCREPVHRPH